MAFHAFDYLTNVIWVSFCEFKFWSITCTMHLNANNAWMRAMPFKNAVHSCLFLVSSHVINIGYLRFLLFLPVMFFIMLT